MPDNSETLTFVFRAQDKLSEALQEQHRGWTQAAVAADEYGKVLKTIQYPVEQFQAISKVLDVAQRGSKLWRTFSVDFQESMQIFTKGLAEQQSGMALYQNQMDLIDQQIQGYRTIVESDKERAGEAAAALALLITEREKLARIGPEPITADDARAAVARSAMIQKAMGGLDAAQKKNIPTNSHLAETLERVVGALEHMEAAGPGAAKAVSAATEAAETGPAGSFMPTPEQFAASYQHAIRTKELRGQAGAGAPAAQLAEAFAKFDPVTKYRKWADLMDELGPKAAAELLKGIEEVRPSLVGLIGSTILKPYEKVRDITKDWAGRVAKFLGDWKDTWKAGGLTAVLRKSFEQAGNLLGKTASKSLQMGMGFLKKLGGSLLAPFTRMLNITEILGPMFSLMERALLPLVVPLQDMFQQIATVLFPVVQQLVPLVLQLVQEALPLFLDLVREIAPVVIKIAQTVLPPFIKLLKAIMPIVTKLAKLFGWLVETILPPVLMIFEALVGAIAWVYNTISAIVKALTFGFVDLGTIETEKAPAAAEPAGGGGQAAEAVTHAGAAYGAAAPLEMERLEPNEAQRQRQLDTEAAHRVRINEARTVAKTAVKTIPAVDRREPTRAEKRRDHEEQQKLIVSELRKLDRDILRAIEAARPWLQTLRPQEVVSFSGYAQYLR